jgi:hypothetical protein
MQRRLLAGVLFILFFVHGSLLVYPTILPGAESRKKVKTAQMRQEIADLADELRKRDQVISGMLKRMEALEQEVRVLRADGVPKTTLAAAPSAEPVQSEKPEAAERKSPPPSTAPGPPTPEEREEEERIARETLDRVLIQRNAVLLSPWLFEIEPSLAYVNSSVDRIIVNGIVIIGVGNIAIGDIVSERIRMNSLISALTFRMGLPWYMQAEARFPFRYDAERVLRADVSERTRDSLGIDDFEFALSRQLLWEKGWQPDLVATARWRAPTADDDLVGASNSTGFHGVQGSLSAVKTKDPVAFFGGVNYTFNLEGDRKGLPIDPGDTYGFNLGLALALSPQTAVNFQYDQRFADQTSVSGFDIPGTRGEFGVIRLGATHGWAKDYFLDFGVGIGVTEDSPDVVVSVAMPFRVPDLFSKARQ